MSTGRGEVFTEMNGLLCVYHMAKYYYSKDLTLIYRAVFHKKGGHFVNLRRHRKKNYVKGNIIKQL